MNTRGKIIRLIDTPGLSSAHQSDLVALQNLAAYFAPLYSAVPSLRLNAIIYVRPIREARWTGTDSRTLEMFKQLCGDQALSSVVMVTTKWNPDFKVVEEWRHEEFKKLYWDDMIEKGTQVFALDNGRASALRIIDSIADMQRKCLLKFQQQVFEEKIDVSETSAALIIEELDTRNGGGEEALRELLEERGAKKKEKEGR